MGSRRSRTRNAVRMKTSSVAGQQLDSDVCCLGIGWLTKLAKGAVMASAKQIAQKFPT